MLDPLLLATLILMAATVAVWAVSAIQVKKQSSEQLASSELTKSRLSDFETAQAAKERLAEVPTSPEELERKRKDDLRRKVEAAFQLEGDGNRVFLRKRESTEHDVWLKQMKLYCDLLREDPQGLPPPPNPPEKISPYTRWISLVILFACETIGVTFSFY